MAAQTCHYFQTSQDVLQNSSKVKWEETTSKHDKQQPSALPTATATEHSDTVGFGNGGTAPQVGSHPCTYH